MRRSTAALAAVVLTAVVGVTGAILGNASQLPVAGGQLSTGSVAHPCPTSALQVSAASAAATQTALVSRAADWPDACEGRPVQIIVTAGSVSASATLSQAPAVGAPATAVTLSAVITPAAAGVSARAVADGWSVEAQWLRVPSLVVVSGSHKTTITLGAWTPSGSLTCVPVSLQVQGSDAWRVDVDVTGHPFDGADPVVTGTIASSYAVVAGPATGWRTIVGTGTYATWHQNKGPLTFSICG